MRLCSHSNTGPIFKHRNFTSGVAAVLFQPQITVQFPLQGFPQVPPTSVHTPCTPSTPLPTGRAQALGGRAVCSLWASPLWQGKSERGAILLSWQRETKAPGAQHGSSWGLHQQEGAGSVEAPQRPRVERGSIGLGAPQGLPQGGR